ncbi:hypothetical protein NQ314_012824 [Rhamnusium bicolor]|uniref:Deoxyribonuclease TATDN1 n=1 Tax=Rhamnusium bicolor TaxID=1586634 RepID=A0AAV8XA18_9CUCU|nr:hypothetical protein NQ314_012824 [Rhamnusium bicolor]
MSKIRRFIDIGGNLTDAMYSGVYNGSKKHQPDLQQVLQRSWEAGLNKIIITGGNLEESKKALELANSDVQFIKNCFHHEITPYLGIQWARLYTTVGCHPTRCSEFEQDGQNPNEYLEKLKEVILTGKSKVVAVGESGLDYERIQFCPKDTQKKYFEYQLKLSESLQLPLFLHCRNAADDLFNILKEYDGLKGVVHSFDGTSEEAQRFIELGYYIGLNGCSLKTQDNLNTIKSLPSNKILIETDCPWCEIRPSHAGYKFISKENLSIPSIKKEKWRPDYMVKSRNEPNNIRQILDVVASVRNEDADELSEKNLSKHLRFIFPMKKRYNKTNISNKNCINNIMAFINK